MTSVETKAAAVLEQLTRDKCLGQYIDASLPIPHPFRGSGEIQLIVLGQDPTIKDATRRSAIRVVLNLDKNGSVKAYLARVCNGLGIDLRTNVYATNLYKGFFVRPPTQITEIDIFQEFSGAWLPLLLEELAPFDNVPVITLGEPLLAPLVHSGVPARVRHYWGYTPDWRAGRLDPLLYIRAQDNRLGRDLFPFPHQPSLRKLFYQARMGDYVSFVKATVFA